MATDALYARNLAALRDHLSDDLFSWLERPTETRSALIETGNGPNIRIGDTLLYPDGAQKHAQSQVAAFLEEPVRRVSLIASNFLFEPDQLGPSDRPFAFTPRPLDPERCLSRLPEAGERVAGDLVRDLLPEIAGLELDWFPDADAGHLVSFGLGLGLHLPMLVEALPVRDLIVADCYPEFLRHSLSVLDWKALSDRIEARGGCLHFNLDQDGRRLAAAVKGALRGGQFIRLDGAYMFQHYANPALSRAIEVLQETASDIEAPPGFFEDEVLMFEHTARNLTGRPHRLLGDLPRLDAGPPVLVVGSGPSVDGDLEHIARLRAEGALVFCAGTGIGPLMRAGITPDLYFEIENVPKIYEGLSPLAETHDFSPITFVGPPSVDPRICALFQRHVFLFRDSVTPTRLFADEYPVMRLAGPTVSNLACRTAFALGLDEIYLFGVDLGSREPDRHHSAGAIYSHLEGEYWRSGAAMDPLVIPVAGNLSDRVYTNPPFLMTRGHFEQLFAAFPDRRVCNCSDGAQITGATLLRAADIRVSFPGTATMQALLDRLPEFPAGALFDPTKARPYGQALQSWFDLADRFVADGEGGFDALIDAMDASVSSGRDARQHGAEAAAQACVMGSMTSMLQFGHVVRRRLPHDRRPGFDHVFRTALARQIGVMRRRTSKMLAHWHE